MRNVFHVVTSPVALQRGLVAALVSLAALARTDTLVGESVRILSRLLFP